MLLLIDAVVVGSGVAVALVAVALVAVALVAVGLVEEEEEEGALENHSLEAALYPLLHSPPAVVYAFFSLFSSK